MPARTGISSIDRSAAEWRLKPERTWAPSDLNCWQSRQKTLSMRLCKSRCRFGSYKSDVGDEIHWTGTVSDSDYRAEERSPNDENEDDRTL